MAISRGKKRLLWVLGVPAAMALTGLLCEAVTLNRLDAAIQEEGRKLENFGVRVRPFTAEEDASEDFDRLTSTLKAIEGSEHWRGYSRKSTSGPQTVLLALYERACAKPWLRPGGDGFWPVDVYWEIEDWVQKFAQDRAKAADWATLDRLHRATIAAFRQRLMSEPSEFESLEGIPLQTLTILRHSSPQARQWLKHKLLASSPVDFEAWQASKVLNTLRHPGAARNGLTLVRQVPPPWWHGWVRRHPISRKTYELELMRSTRLALLRRRANPSIGLAASLYKNLHNDLTGKKSWLVDLFLSQHQFGFTICPTPEHERRNLLIELDLREAMEERRELKPTWSKPLCIDPATGIPVRVTVKGRQVRIYSPNPNCNWDSNFKL